MLHFDAPSASLQNMAAIFFKSSPERDIEVSLDLRGTPLDLWLSMNSLDPELPQGTSAQVILNDP